MRAGGVAGAKYSVLFVRMSFKEAKDKKFKEDIVGL